MAVIPTAAPELRQLRNALGRFATGVTIVTCQDGEGARVGLTANSFNALSLDPPLVLWSLRRASPAAQAFVAARHFAINVLAQAQMGLSQRFAARDLDRFAEGDWTENAQGVPVLARCAAVFECETASHQAAGDHWLFIGRVLACTEQPLEPLVFQAGRYRQLGPELLMP